MIRLQTIVNELRVTDLSRMKDNPENKKYFLVYKDKLFILDDESPIAGVNARIKKHVKTHPGMKDTKSSWSPMHVDDVHEFLTRMAEVSPDVVTGEYYPDNHSIVVWSGQEVMPRTSLIVKKIAQALNLDNAIYRYNDEPKYDDEIAITYPANKLVGGIPDVMYHGTNSHALRSILKFGLMPGKGESRFKSRGIIHPYHVFFTAEFQQAKFYAFNAKANEEKKYNNYPIIVEFTVPDKRLLYPDFDADMNSTKKHSFPTFGRTQTPVSDMDPMGISREIGKWSYKGRIPASHIRWIYYYKPFEHKWYKSKPETWQKLLWQYDWDQLGWKLGLNGEDDL